MYIKKNEENEIKKELEDNLIQRPQKERKKKTREGPKKKVENSLNTNSSEEDLHAPKPKYNLIYYINYYIRIFKKSNIITFNIIIINIKKIKN